MISGKSREPILFSRVAVHPLSDQRKAGPRQGFAGHWGWRQMSKEAEYRKHAAALLDLAKRASTRHDRNRLVAISEAWLSLADKLARLARRRKTTEQLFRQILRETDHMRSDGSLG
jgi:hypothetical protein